MRQIHTKKPVLCLIHNHIGYFDLYREICEHVLCLSPTAIECLSTPNQSLPSSPLNYSLIIVFGGMMSVHDAPTHEWLNNELLFIKKAIDNEVPCLGICLGAQMIAKILGSEIVKNTFKTDVFSDKKIMQDNHPLTKKITHYRSFSYHTESIKPSEDLTVLSGTNDHIDIFAYKEHVLGIQSHIEITASMLQQWHVDGITQDYTNHIVQHKATQRDNHQILRAVIRHLAPHLEYSGVSS